MPRAKKLPELPYGQGTFSWYNDEHTKIRFLRNYSCKSDGKKYRLEVVGESVQICYDKMSKKEKELEASKGKAFRTSLENPNIILSNALYEWLNKVKKGKIKANAFDRIECTIKNQIDGYTIALWRVLDIEEKDLQNHLNSLRYDKSYSLSTLKKVYDVLKQFFADFYRKNPQDNPMKNIERPKEENEIGEISIDDDTSPDEIKEIVLTDDEIKTFKEYCYRKPANGILGGTKYGVHLYFMLLTFIRIGEALSLTWNDIDIDNKIMRINKTVTRVKNRNSDPEISHKTKLIITKPKTKKSIREVVLTDEAIEALQHIKNNSQYTSSSDFVIVSSNGTMVLEQNLRNSLKGILKASGLNENGKRNKFGLHYLRHSGISFYLRHGVQVDVISQMAGHASTAITMNTYYHIIKQQKYDALNKMNLFIGQKEKGDKNEKRI